ncbi:hypothetical protein DPMN_175768 [Dreissena polymorpha]|uniref:Uncharacterized protein n=1 Tax=Dreissena polymorpha TaxID=45954 RepID=A0A9D4E8W1_DREPO|nr:hypothetical protein DPMN_175768 [Dreissena polymorpha]
MDDFCLLYPVMYNLFLEKINRTITSISLFVGDRFPTRDLLMSLTSWAAPVVRFADDFDLMGGTSSEIC